ncbi:two-component system response regulator [Telmatospirillum siberiense]|uniref:Two-component system response regulator n=2 Tax=Telmatospirillum siberiense TaxID=382514 RepID=A0A2N3PVN4_9PROT|nr:two-component system response regulator [Telmatospirillum siberiense]
MPTMLVVDDDEGIRRFLSAMLTKQGFGVLTADNGFDAVEIFRAERPAVILMDIRMPGMSGLKAMSAIHNLDRSTAVILMTAYAEVETAVQAIKDGAFDYIIKPFDIAEVLLLVKRAFELRRMREDISVLHRELSESFRLDRILTNSPKMIELCQTITKVAKSTATVLVCGESGTGKELVATAIHYNSARADKPFVKVNCAAIPDSLLESEFFGHEKGAFTGALARRRGRFEQACGGTLFLDEIGDISPSLQVKLLRVLQEREFERVGGGDVVRADVRVIVATNKNLEELVRQGTFRQDLYFRLNVVTIKTIALRERPEDVRLLAGYFLQKFAAENCIEITGFDEAAMDCLLRHDWPGNIRELRNAVERAVVMSTGREIGPEDLPEQILHSAGEFEGLPRPPFDGAVRSLRDLVHRYEAQVITESLARNDGNRVKTAHDLQISRRSLLYKIQEHGIG